MNNELDAMKSYDKIDNTLCLNNNRCNIEFAISEDENIDCKDAYEMTKCLNNIYQALQELQAIKNAVPSDAMECIKRIWDDIDVYNSFRQDFNDLKTIENYILKAQDQEKENELLKEIIKSFFDRGCPLHQYTDKEGVLQIEIDSECSLMHLGEFKGVDLDSKLKEVLEDE